MSLQRKKQQPFNHQLKTEKRMSLSNLKMLQVSKCLIGLAAMMLQSCDVAEDTRAALCGN